MSGRRAALMGLRRRWRSGPADKTEERRSCGDGERSCGGERTAAKGERWLHSSGGRVAAAQDCFNLKLLGWVSLAVWADLFFSFFSYFSLLLG